MLSAAVCNVIEVRTAALLVVAVLAVVCERIV
jgi:hypothetical protein